MGHFFITMYTLLFLFAFISIFFSFLCSLWESVLLSITPSYTQGKINEKTKIGKTLEEFKENIDKPLSSILTLNTIAHTAGAIGVGNQASKIWSEANPLITSIAVPAIMTLAILIISEIIPKTIGANNWRKLAPFTVKSLSILLRILYPLVWLCQSITNIFLKNDEEKSIFSRSDFLALAQIGSREGELSETESSFISNLLRFKDHVVEDIMTPRTVAVMAPNDMTIKEFYDKQDELVFSRIPLFHPEDKDNITGYVLKDDILEHLVEGEKNKPLQVLKRDIVVVDEKYGVLKMFNEFIAQREHIALVVDEFGAMQGLVSMEDVVETLLGTEIVDEKDENVDMQDLARKKWESRHKNKKINK
jgi:CBS domain containing-hemolysin-like protein